MLGPCLLIHFIINFNLQIQMAGDSKSKKKGEGQDKSVKSGKSKSKEKEPKSPSKSVSKKQKQKQSKPKKAGSKIKKDDQSDVSSILPTAPPAADCVHHKSPFIYYCETCQQLICNQCTVYGPHNNHLQLHRILKITDAYRSRVYYLSEAIRTNLVDKRDKIIAQLHRLQYRVEEIRFVKNIIARDIRSQYSGILERLKSQQGIKLAQLSHEVSLAQREVDNINDIGNTFFDLTSMEGDQVTRDRNICKFLLKSKKMYEAIEYILHKADRPLPDIKPQELPHEIEETKSLIQKALAAKQINDFKNQVIFNLSRDLREQEKKIKAEVQSKADGMIRKLSEEAESLNKRLNQFKMVCFYCGIRLNPKGINNECEANRSDSSSIGANLKVVKTPPQNFNHNGRHFFTRLIEQEEHK